jgi:membrane protease YdiL (CAAX protease family)
MPTTERKTILVDSLVISISLMVFSWFIQYELPLKLISFVALLVAAFVISKYLVKKQSLRMIMGDRNSAAKFSGMLIIGFASGSALAVAYRYYHDWSFWPERIHYFALVAALIGCGEELLYRGFLQGLLNEINGLFAVVMATLSHTGYKVFLFMAPVIAGKADIGFIFAWTFGVGLVFGLARHFTRSIWIPLAAHVVFDFVSYASFAQSPWWVW